MTIGQVLQEIEEKQPSTMPTADKIRWLWRLDLELWQRVIRKHERRCGEEWIAPPEYNEDTPEDTQLLVAAPYDSIYVHYLMSRIDFENNEISRYNNSNAMYQGDRDAWETWYIQTHRPRRTREVFF